MAEQLEESQQLLDESIQIEEIEQYRSVFRKAEKEKNITESNKFSYAYCLIRSKKKGDVREGLTLLRELYESTKEDGAKRDYIFYMALGNARINEYEQSLKFLDAILSVEPQNHQAKRLHEEVSRRMKRDGYLGIGIVAGAGALVIGGTALVIGGLAAAAIALTKK